MHQEDVSFSPAASSTPLPTTAAAHQELLAMVRRHQDDELAQFFRRICSTVRKLKPVNVIKIKRILSTAIHHTELKELETQQEEASESTLVAVNEEEGEGDLDDDVFQ